MFKKAVKEKLKCRLAIEGPSGSGKSYSALLIARGLVGDEGRIAMIDTEKESGKLYADVTEFDHATLNEPYTPERYISLIDMAKGYDCIIIDSMSHEWVGAGGILEIHDKMPGNSWTNWSKCNPRHDAFINAILKAPCHVIVTLRSKQSYTQDEDASGKKQVKKLGLAPQQRDGIEYELTAVLKMDVSHQAEGDKDRTGLFPIGTWFTPSVETGKTLAAFLDAGVVPEVRPEQPIQPHQPEPEITAWEDLAAIVDEWEKEADKNDKTVDTLGEWYKKNADKIKALPLPARTKINAYVKQLKEAKAAPVSWECPRGGKVTTVECEACEASADCENYQSKLKK